MKLYVDDVRAAPEGWERASSVEAAIRMIATYTGKIDAISLDHDAGQHQTFQPVAYFIGEKYVDKPKRQVPRIHLHTQNPSGEKHLRNILSRYGIDIV